MTNLNETFVALLISMIVQSQSGYAQEAPALFRSETRMVTNLVTFFDPHGEVSDIEASQCSITDNDQPQTIRVFERDTRPLDVFVLADMSASMSRNDGAVRLTALRRVVADIIRAMKPRDRFQAASFGKNTYSSTGLFSLSSPIPKASPLDPDDDIPTSMDDIFAEITPVIGEQRYTGLKNVLSASFAAVAGEDLTGALTLTLKQLLQSSDSKRVLLLFTDGGNSSPTEHWGVVRKHLAKSSVQLITISYTESGKAGGDIGEFQESLKNLRILSEKSGAQFVEANQPQDWPTLISRMLSPYRMAYNVGFYPKESTPGEYRKLSLACEPSRLRVRMRNEYLSE